ncbi:MAG TPA: NAD(P)/FAD-dependent oxidoreductase [Xanthobacteraceae bacterium]
MNPLSRRSFLTASAAVASAGAVAQPRRAVPGRQPSPIVDVVVIGAGAAGIAAARRLAAARLQVAVVEAMPRVGGRCITDTTSFDVPFDRGAHWLHVPEINPVAKLAALPGIDIYPAPPGQRIRIGRRYAREAEMEDYLAALVRATTAIGEAARGRLDVSCAQALPKDLGEWRSTIEFVLGPFGCAKDLADVSAMDFARSSERDTDAFCRQGLGTLVARLATAIPVQLSTRVTRVNYGERFGCELLTAKGQLRSRAVIVTVSTSVLASGRIAFDPDLPKRQLDAAASLKLGSYDHVALEIPGNPFDLRADELVFEKSSGPRTAALLGNSGGSTLCIVDVAGSFGRDLAAKGEQEMIAFALDWLSDLYGAAVKNSVKRRLATRWNQEPTALGAFSAAAPGSQGARRVLMEPVRNRLWFAGEAVHETLWGTVGGAWESGERAAAAVVRSLTGRG